MFSFIDGFYPSFHASLKQHVWFSLRDTKRLQLTHVTQYSESLTIISFLMNVFPQKLVITSGSWHKKNYKNWGPTMSFRASKSGLGYEVQKKLEAVRLQNLYPCNIYRTVTSSLSISFITLQTEKTMLSLHVFRFNKYHHCFCPAWSNVLYHAFYSFLGQAACFLIKFILCLCKNFNIFLPQTNLEKSFQVSLCLSARRSTENSKIYF